jgi:hypothetical protein
LDEIPSALLQQALHSAVTDGLIRAIRRETQGMVLDHRLAFAAASAVLPAIPGPMRSWR